MEAIKTLTLTEQSISKNAREQFFFIASAKHEYPNMLIFGLFRISILMRDLKFGNVFASSITSI